MNITVRGHVLNQRQLDAVTPVLNDVMQGRLTEKGFEDKCIVALEAAGYDTTMPSAAATVQERAAAWKKDGNVGSSSRAIYDHMLGLPPHRDEYCFPYDPADLNRCLLLLELIPEWRARMPEMAQRGTEWAGLVAKWGVITATFLEEVGLNWSKGQRLHATETYKLMREATGR